MHCGNEPGMPDCSPIGTVFVSRPKKAVGPTVAGLLTAHGLLVWAGLEQKDKPARIRYTISMLNHIVWIFWAIACPLGNLGCVTLRRRVRPATPYSSGDLPA